MSRKRIVLITASLGIIAILVSGIVLNGFAVGGPRKISIQLWYNSDGHYGDTEPAVAQIVKESLESTKLLNVTLRSEPWAYYRSDLASGRLPLFLLGWYPDYFDADGYISPFLTTLGARSLGSNYNGSQMDQLVAQEQKTPDPSIRALLFEQIQRKLVDDVPYVPLWQGGASIVYDDDITGVVLHPLSFKYSIMGNPNGRLQGQLSVGTTDRMVSLDPAASYDYFSMEVVNQLFDTLLVYGPTNASLLPGLATEVPTIQNGGIALDGLTYTYHLRQGVTFHDGSAFNSTVMKWSIERAINLDFPGGPAFLLYDVGKLTRTPHIETPDPYTIMFHLSQPLGFFNELMAFSVAAPVSMASYSMTAEQADEVGKVVGTGPYILTAHTPGNQIVLTSNPSYYNRELYQPFGIPGIPILGRITIDQFADSSSLKEAIVTHSINMAYRTLNLSDLVDLQNRASLLGLKVDSGAGLQIRFLVFNVHQPPFDDVRLRQAIAYAIDRAAIGRNAFLNFVSPLYSLVPPSIPYSQPVFAMKYGESPNLHLAERLLRQILHETRSGNGPGTAQGVADLAFWTQSLIWSFPLVGLFTGHRTVVPRTGALSSRASNIPRLLQGLKHGSLRQGRAGSSCPQAYTNNLL